MFVKITVDQILISVLLGLEDPNRPFAALNIKYGRICALIPVYQTDINRQ